MAAIRKKRRISVARSGYPSQTKTFETKQEAEAWAATIESEMARASLFQEPWLKK